MRRHRPAPERVPLGEAARVVLVSCVAHQLRKQVRAIRDRAVVAGCAHFWVVAPLPARRRHLAARNGDCRRAASRSAIADALSPNGKDCLLGY